jgi:FtsP/CotA-like multicopper oxidase with cupredoxin domain
VAPQEAGDYLLQYQQVTDLSKQADVTPDTLLIVRVVKEGKTTGAVCKSPETCLQEINMPPLPEYLRDIDPEPTKRQTVTFSMNPDAATAPGSKVFIDESLYDSDFIHHRVSLSRPEVWEIRNTSTTPHPFHIHVNPFQVTKVMDKALSQPWVWWDVFPLPVKTVDVPVGTVTVRHRFLEFTGKYVLHCHILGHEDRGMMQNVLAEP